MKFNPMRGRIPILKRAYPSLRRRWDDAFAVNGFRLKRWADAAFLLQHRNYVDRQIAFYGDFEDTQRAFFFAAMARFPCDLFLDIGANIGLYSILAGRRGLARRIVAFEPDERNALQLGANVLMNDLVGRVEIVRAAVTDHNGEIAFLPAAKSSTGQSRVRGPEDEAGGGVRVQALRLDDMFAVSGQRIFVKIDIEGHEQTALSGMTQLMARNAMFIQAESFAPSAPALEAFLAAHGFQRRGQIQSDHYFSNFDSEAASPPG
ncbi:MAG: FkbM family methyltransferase [Hyphomonadaceae bacterium]